MKQHELSKFAASWTITKHFGAKDTVRFLNIICYDEVDPKSGYDSSYLLRHIKFGRWFSSLEPN